MFAEGIQTCSKMWQQIIINRDDVQRDTDDQVWCSSFRVLLQNTHGIHDLSQGSDESVGRLLSPDL